MNTGPKGTRLSIVRGACAYKTTAGQFYSFVAAVNMSHTAGSHRTECVHLPVLLGFSKRSRADQHTHVFT